MKLECNTCCKFYHKDYVLITGPYWYKQMKNQAMCVHCFERFYKKQIGGKQNIYKFSICLT